MKIAINKRYGGFSVSREVVDKLRLKGHKIVVDGELYRDGSGHRKNGDKHGYYLDNEDFGIQSENLYQYRSHPDLIEAIETSKKPNGFLSCIKVIEIPDGVDWELDSYDGVESIHEKHRAW